MTYTFQLCICFTYKWCKTTEPSLAIFHTLKWPLSVNDFLLEAVICVWTWVPVNLNLTERDRAICCTVS